MLALALILSCICLLCYLCPGRNLWKRLGNSQTLLCSCRSICTSILLNNAAALEGSGWRADSICLFCNFYPVRNFWSGLESCQVLAGLLELSPLAKPPPALLPGHQVQNLHSRIHLFEVGKYPWQGMPTSHWCCTRQAQGGRYNSRLHYHCLAST